MQLYLQQMMPLEGKINHVNPEQVNLHSYVFEISIIHFKCLKKNFFWSVSHDVMREKNVALSLSRYLR